MLYPPLQNAVFIKRLNRFAALIKLQDDDIVTAHVPSSGRMHELLFEGAPVMAALSRNPSRATRYTIILAYNKGVWVSVDSHLPNRLASKALVLGKILPKHASTIYMVRSEVPYGGSRLDFLLESDNGHCIVEIKSVTLVENGTAKFPGAPTIRGARQLVDIRRGVEEGLGGMVVFIIQRSDAVSFTPNDRTDPEFGERLREAAQSGAELRAFVCDVTPDSIALEREVSIGL